MRRSLATLPLLGTLAAWLAPAFAQAPPPIPNLPDAERRTSYSISATTCACSVGFALYGTSTDVDEWIQVWVAGVQYKSTDATFGWKLTSATGSLATIARPITDAVLTFNSAQTGTVQIVGAERPRRTAQFAENRGVAARDLNQTITDLVAQNREQWDLLNRVLQGLPSEVIGPLPSAAARAGGFLCFDGTGLIPLACAPTNGTGNVGGPNTSVDGHIAVFNGATGKIIRDGGALGTGTVAGPVSSTNGGFAQWNGTTGLVLQDGPTLIPMANGGCNAALTASNGGLVYSTGSACAILAGTATAGQIPLSGSSSAPTWSTTTWPGTVAINSLLYASSANVMAALAPCNSGVVVYSAGGIPSCSTSIPFTQSGTGAVASSVNTKLKGLALNAKTDFGAVGDGSTDDTTALQNCITQAETLGATGICHLPSGTYKTTAALSVTGSVAIEGDGSTISVIQPVVTIDGIDIVTTGPVTIRSLAINYPSQANSGKAGITLSASAGNLNSQSTFRDLEMLNDNIGISIIQANAWTIDNVRIVNFNNVGIIAQNTVSPNDAGDNIIANSYLQGVGGGANACVQWTSGGALNYHNNNCVGSGSVTYGILAQLVSAAGTGQMIVSGNTFDANGMIGLSFTRSGATGTFGRLVFTGNICNRALGCLSIPNDANGNAITDVIASGNTLFGANNVSTFGFAIDSATNILISGNTFNSQNASTRAFVIGGSVSGCTISNTQLTGTFAASTYSSTCNYPGYKVSSNVLIGAAVGVTSASPTTVTSISLPAGEWDVWGNIVTNPAGGTTTTVVGAWIHTVTNALPTAPNGGSYSFVNASVAAGLADGLSAGNIHYSLTTTTTVYLECYVTFATSTNGCYGYIEAKPRY